MDMSPALSITKDAITLQVMAAIVDMGNKDGQPPMGITRLMKLVYFADRESLIQHGRPITYSDYGALKYGPIAWRALRVSEHGLDGTARHMYLDCPPPRQTIDDEQKSRPVSLTEQLSRDDFDLISDESMDVIRAIWEKWGREPDVVGAAHELPEYKRCQGTSITFHAVLSAGRPDLNEDERMALANEVAYAGQFIPDKLRADAASP